MYIILINELKHTTKEIFKILGIMAIAFWVIIAIIVIKYKPMYEVTLSGEKIGLIENQKEFENSLEENLININGKNVDNITLTEKPEYELKLVSRDEQTNEEEILTAINETVTTTYKCYAVTLDDNVKAYVDTFEEATKIVEDIKSEYENDLDLNLQIVEKYTQNMDELTTETVEVAENNISNEVEVIIEENKYVKINGVKLASMPIDVSYRLTSRFGEVSSIRNMSSHKGLDIACAAGSNIKAVADGTVIASSYNGSYGNLVKIDHGNGVQTWYAHCSKLYAKVGQKVKAGDVIAAVGSTGNSTGPHSHLEIRINGAAVNPQKYIYN